MEIKSQSYCGMERVLILRD